MASGANAPPVHGIKKCLVYNDISLYKEGTFITKRALFITKKDTFSPLKKFEGARAPPPPGSYAPEFA